MPRTLVINGRFNPYSYEDYIKPLQQSTEQHQQVEAAYGELGAAADLWADIAMNEKDSEAAAMYSKYSDDLRKQADNLAMYGLNGNSRRELFNMKRRYASEIQPIENAYNARVEDIKLQRELSAKDPSLLWNSSASSASIDSYLHGNRPDYYSVSGDDMYKRAATGAKAINDMFVNAEERTAFNNAYFDLVERKGMPPEMALQMMYNSGSFGVFDRLMDTLHEGSNYNKLQDEGKAQIDARIMEGIAAGLSYDEKHNIQRNYPYEMALQNAYSKDLANYKAALSAASAGASGQTGSSVALSTQRLVSRNTDTKKLRRKANKFGSNPIVDHFSTGARYDSKINLSKALDSTTIMNGWNLRNKEGKNEFQVFDASGNLLSEEAFLAQAGDERTRRNLQKIRKDLVKDMSSVGGTTNIEDAFSGYNDIMTGSNPFDVEAMEISIGKLGGDNDAAMRRILSITGGGVGIEEVDGFDASGLVSSGKKAKVEELMAAAKDGTISYNIVGDSVLIRTPQKDYQIPLNKLGSLGREAAAMAEQFDDYRGQLLDRARAEGLSLESFLYKYGLIDYYDNVSRALLKSAVSALGYGVQTPEEKPWSVGKKEVGPSYEDEE